jgi:hypothetical protein
MNKLAQALAGQSPAFIEGFIEKCAAAGVDPMALVKQAGWMDRYRQYNQEVGGYDMQDSGLSRMRERIKRLALTAWYEPQGGFLTSSRDWQMRVQEAKNRQRTTNQYWKHQLNPTPSYYEQWQKKYEASDPFLRKRVGMQADFTPDTPQPIPAQPQPPKSPFMP